MTFLTDDYWSLILCLIVLGSSVGLLFMLSKQAAAKAECYRCHREMGLVFKEEWIESPPDTDYDLYRRYRVCQHCHTPLETETVERPRKDEIN